MEETFGSPKATILELSSESLCQACHTPHPGVPSLLLASPVVGDCNAPVARLFGSAAKVGDPALKRGRVD
jgi:hypothetical protein